MKRTGHLHWVGVLLIFTSAILLLITTITAPVIGDLAMLKVTLTNSSALRHSSVTFGTFGYCVLDVAPADTDQDYCAGRSIGYSPAKVMKAIDSTGFSEAASVTADGLTNTMVLHPIACGLAFIAFLLSFGAGVVGSLLGALVAGLAWIITLVAMAIDFTLFKVIKDNVNGDGSGSVAYFSVGMWTILAAMILLFFGMFIVLFTCFSARRANKGGVYESKHSNGHATTTRRRRRFGLY